MPTIAEQFRNRENVLMKFSDAPFTGSGVLNPGWAEPTYDDFFMRLVDTPVLLEQSTVFPMTALEHDIDDLEIKVELDAQRTISGGVLGESTNLTANETVPKRNRQKLRAVPLQCKTIIGDNFLEENIEKEGFLDKYLGRLGEAMGPAFELWGVYADQSVSTVSGEGTGYGLSNGLLAQCKEIASDTNTDTEGLAKLITHETLIDGILNAVYTYIDQDGDLNNATMVLPPTIYSRLMGAIARDRNSDLGDLVIQKGKMTTIMGVEIKSDNILRQTRNGYDTMKFTNGEYKGNGTNTTDMKYGFIGRPANTVFGMMKHIETANQYDIDVWGWKVAGRVKGDVKIHWDQDTLAIPFAPTATEANTVFKKDNEPIVVNVTP
ncbi:hypothetical protein [Methanobrevibacter olleyae]|uniref:Major capsid protein n=1 Tax=Methanobrevibacter olleyae TaxID=294671 RepID=A0A126R2N9_METOL|nr:hypothetical protein [Methanobrevibacter olleyae]AMK16318.1 hypothetical protein YLM1_1763 [Methanobrevibacter olleyae]